ncbi:MAG: hypothetical protein RL201_568 [Actinomycetota bacterium]|jgi:Bacterial protein of unknown function (DUF839)
MRDWFLMKRNLKIGAALSAVVVAVSGGVAYSASLKPNYILPGTGVEINPIAYAGDKITSTVVRGVPDGMGAYKNAAGDITLLSVHEIPSYSALAQLSKSSTSQWGVSITEFNYSTKSKKITSAKNFIQDIKYYNYNTGAYTDTPIGGAPAGTTKGLDWNISRFCSATFVQAGNLAFKDGGTTYGYEGGVFFSGEEDADSGYGRAFAFDTDGHGIQLPKMGLASWENLMPNLKPGINTVVMHNEDGSATDSQLFMYVGTKTTSGTFADKAGLTNGELQVASIPDIANDNAFRAKYGKNNPVSIEFKKTIWNANMDAQKADHAAVGTEFSRIEDGEWDPSNPNVFYFITTESNKDAAATKPNPAEPTISRDGGALWRLTFVDGQKPELGAKIEMLLDGSEAPYLSKPDNMAITENGIVMIQEDPGNNAHVSRILAFRPSDKKFAKVAEFNPEYFTPTGAQFMTIDEETSGIINVTKLLAKDGDKATYFFFNAQVHTDGAAKARPDLPSKSAPRKLAIDKATVEGGAYYVMKIADWNEVFTS